MHARGLADGQRSTDVGASGARRIGVRRIGARTVGAAVVLGLAVAGGAPARAATGPAPVTPDMRATAVPSAPPPTVPATGSAAVGSAATVGATANGLLAAAATSGPVYGHVQLTPIALTGDPSGAVLVGSRLWVAAWDTVFVFDVAGGAKLATFAVPSAGDPVTDGTTVYVPSTTGTQVHRFDAATLTSRTPLSMGGCPDWASVAAGRLWVSYGCSAGDPSAVGIASVALADDPADGLAVTHVTVPGSPAFRPLVAAAGSTLVAATSGSPSTLSSWTVAANGTATLRPGSATTSTIYDLAVSPNGATLAVTGYGSPGYTIERYRTDTLAALAPLPLDSYPTSVMWSADGTRLAGGVTSSYELTARVFDTATDGAVAQVRSHAPGTSSYAGITARTLVWSADRAWLYGVVVDAGRPYLATMSTTPPTPVSLTLSVTKPSAYGKRLAVRVTSPGRANAPVTVTWTGLKGTLRRTATTDAAGRLTLALPVQVNGIVTVTHTVTHRYTAAKASARYTVPAGLVVAMSKPYRTVKKVGRYHKASDVRLAMQALPARGSEVVVVLQRKKAGKWTTYASTNLTTDAKGLQGVYLKGAWPKRVTFRFKVWVRADGVVTRSPSVYSKRFQIR